VKKRTVILESGLQVEAAIQARGPLLPVREAAVLRGLSRQWIHKLVHRGVVIDYQVFGHRFVALREL